MEVERRSSDIKLAVLSNDITYIKKAVDEVKNLVTENYVTHQEFMPIRNLVYGFTGLILIAVIGGIVSLVVRK